MYFVYNVSVNLRLLFFFYLTCNSHTLLFIFFGDIHFIASAACKSNFELINIKNVIILVFSKLSTSDGVTE